MSISHALEMARVENHEQAQLVRDAIYEYFEGKNCSEGKGQVYSQLYIYIVYKIGKAPPFQQLTPACHDISACFDESTIGNPW
ncbi:hypothetical protein Agabi119p4_8606 [Agaricus bisporus var. burnettii]|uniref:Uncharacterized protein n=1 Tax=Agaricus bisporus var. burnettii TaxID=192524 RepID=A0A8H7EZ51_AGABI|nr:hypothetical protein Agabi119p4_8606 [Agaricus bisporus var. burnettii]